MSSFGRLFRVSTFGESHGIGVGVVIEGYPSNEEFPLSFIQLALDKRRPGQSKIVTSRHELDQVKVISGVQQVTEIDGTTKLITLGSPICLMVENMDHRPQDYIPYILENSEENSQQVPAVSQSFLEMSVPPRPSHADLTWYYKYGLMSKSGGGRASGRETIGRVAAGALAKYYLEKYYQIEICAFVTAIGHLSLAETSNLAANSIDVHPENPIQQMLAYEVNRLSGGEQNVETEEEDPWSQFIEARDMNIVRCPDAYNSHRMIQLLEQIQSEGDSIGSEVTCLIRRCPLGLGEPVFDKVHALLGHAMLSIPACKGIQFGEGFDVVKMRGSHHNDPITGLVQSPREESNGSSSSRQCNGAKAFYTMSQNQNVGLQGGISNGYPIYFRVPFKPPSTIGIPQSSVLPTGEKVQVSYKGRHDPCIGPRAVPIVEAMTALVLMDLLLIQNNNATDKLNI